MPGTLFLLTGVSGVGKTTVTKRLLGNNPHLKRIVTYTTRPPREGEINGVSYHFVDQQTFRAMIDADAFLEWANVYGNNYGETKSDVENLQRQGFDVLIVLDPQGAKTIKTSGVKAVAIFLDATDEEILKRLTSRGKDHPDVIQKRIDAMTFDRSHIGSCDVVIKNSQGELETTVKKIEAFIKQAK